MQSQPSLSICIPTYNRADILKKALESICSDPAFLTTKEIEVVISDNASTDRTRLVSQYFVNNYPGKVIYHRNEENTFERNFEIVLSHGKGKLLKLYNDYLTVEEGALAKILEHVKKYEAEKPILFYLNGNTHSTKNLEEFDSLNDFVCHASYFLTWIGAFSIWKTQFESVNDFSRYQNLLLPHVDVLFRLIDVNKKIVVLNELLFGGEYTKARSGYNVAEVFGKNYLFLLNFYQSSKKISDENYELQKYKMLVHHINPNYFSLYHKYTKNGYFRNLKDYYKNAYFWILAFKGYSSLLIEKLKINLKKL